MLYAIFVNATLAMRKVACDHAVATGMPLCVQEIEGVSFVKIVKQNRQKWCAKHVGKTARIDYCFFLKIERAISVSDGPPKRSWSEWRPHVVCTLTVGDGLTKPNEAVREFVDDATEAEVATELAQELVRFCNELLLETVWCW